MSFRSIGRLTICCLIIAVLSWHSLMAASCICDVDGVRCISLGALAGYCKGSVRRDNQGRIVCDLAGQQFKLRAGSSNIFIGGKIEQLSGKVSDRGGSLFVPIDLVHKIGWTCRPTPTGYDIHCPSLGDTLAMSSTGYAVERRKPGVCAKGDVGVWYITLFYPKGKGAYYWDSVVARGGAMPSCGPYELSDPKVIERQWREMCECGIDFILMDDTNTVWVDGGLVDANIRAWFNFMDNLPADERIPIAIAAGGELNQHSDKDGWKKAVDYIWDTYAQRPSYLRYDGKPVLNWYIEKDVWSDWTDDRWIIRPTYHFFRTADQITHGGWGYGSDENPRCISECLSFHPGWDLSLPGHQREGGEFYRRLWINAVKCHPRHVLLSDWNGWNEGTAIEDSDSWKDTYGDTAPSWYRLLTRGYAAAYKGSLIDEFYYRDEASPDVFQWKGGKFIYQGAYPHKMPVIVLPSGYYKMFTRAEMEK